MAPHPNPKREMFAREYLVDLCGAAAARRAGYSDRTSARQAHQLLNDPAVQARIAELMAEREKALELDAAAVVKRWTEIATADPRDLMERRVAPCRYCHGIDHGYQWRTRREFEIARASWQAEWDAEHERDGPRRSVIARLEASEPVADGGFGYRKTMPPDPSCPECDGLGIGYTVLRDVTHIPAQAALLYAGVKETDKGVEIKVHDQMHALDQIARHLGMFEKDNAQRTPNMDPIAEAIAQIGRAGSRMPIATKPPAEA